MDHPAYYDRAAASGTVHIPFYRPLVFLWMLIAANNSYMNIREALPVSSPIIKKTPAAVNCCRCFMLTDGETVLRLLQQQHFLGKCHTA
jgi:hypothetical protein